MIAIESIKRFRGRDAIIIGGAGGAFTIGQLLLKFTGIDTAYFGSLLLIGLLLSASTLLVRKAGTATMVGVLSALLSFGNGVAGAIGWRKVAVFAIAGLLFELTFLLLKIELHLIPLDIIIGTALAVASVPISTLFFLSSAMAIDNVWKLANMALLGFFTGMLSAVLVFLAWFRLRYVRAVLWFEYG